MTWGAPATVRWSRPYIPYKGIEAPNVTIFSWGIPHLLNKQDDEEYLYSFLNHLHMPLTLSLIYCSRYLLRHK